MSASCTTQSLTKKPDWLRVRVSDKHHEMGAILKSLNLRTVCEEAACPNLPNCWSRRHAAVIIAGDTCTRACKFCNIKNGKPLPLDPNEPFNIGDMALKLKLAHIVVTAVARDDLRDGGAAHFSQVIKAVRILSPQTTVEVLTPDFMHKAGALDIVIKQQPDVFAHNIETVRRLHKSIRSGANYDYSLQVLLNAKKIDSSIVTKSSFMVGIGETYDEIVELLHDLRAADVDFVTIGQYLPPTKDDYPLARYVTPDEFASYKAEAIKLGFLMVASSPLTRSSYNADVDFKELRERRESKRLKKGDGYMGDSPFIAKESQRC